jgi:hypothetical protein
MTKRTMTLSSDQKCKILGACKGPSYALGSLSDALPAKDVPMEGDGSTGLPGRKSLMAHAQEFTILQPKSYLRLQESLA